ncbi:MAG: hypothetical protein HQL96_00880 [Magnetococcales bacterium]|nr:hypothetical protein [Magnetococcales bacterium]
MISLSELPQRDAQSALELASRFAGSESRHQEAPCAPPWEEELADAIFQSLSATLPIAVVAYWNPRLRKSHLVSRVPLSEPDNLHRLVDGLIHGAVPRVRHWRQQEWFFHLWMGAPLETWDRLLVVESEGRLSAAEFNTLLQQEVGRFTPTQARV